MSRPDDNAWNIAGVKKGGGIFPATAYAQEVMDRIPEGHRATLEFTSERNWKHHDQLFGALKAFLDAIPDPYWPNLDSFRHAMLLAIGEVTPLVGLDGRVAFMPKSMRANAMTKEVFNEVYDRMIAKAAERYYPDFTKEQIAHIEAILLGNQIPVIGERVR